jgi:cytochrome c nitrite reductase small subunit
MRASVISGTLVGTFVGLALGIGGYTFVYAKGWSYLTNNPQACANCHVMEEQYSGWLKSSHRNAATCNDCHTPHDIVGKYATKAENGFWHSFYFTTGGYPENISAREKSRRITEQQCRRCHADIADDVSSPHPTASLSCIQCHGHVGHEK